MNLRSIGKTIRFGAALIAGLTVAMSAQGQGTLSQGAAGWAVGASCFDGTPEVDLIGIAPLPAADHVNLSGWWYRISGDASEKFLPVPDVQSFVGNTATLTWVDIDGRGFDATETQTLTSLGNGFRLRSILQIHNPGGSPLTLDLFHAIDMDINGTAADDTAALNIANTEIGITDGGTITGIYRGNGATNCIATNVGGSDVVTMLNDGDSDNLDNSGLPFAAGDLEMGFQWVGVVVSANGNTQVQAEFSLTRPAAVPTPSPITSGYFPNNDHGRATAFFTDVAPPPGTNRHRIRVRTPSGTVLNSVFIPFAGQPPASGVTNFNLPLGDADPNSWETGIVVIIDAMNNGITLATRTVVGINHSSSDETDFDFNSPVIPADPPGIYSATLTDSRPTGQTNHYTYDIIRRIFAPVSTTQVSQATHGIIGSFNVQVEHSSTLVPINLPLVAGQQMLWSRPRDSYKNSAGGNLGRFDVAPKSPNLYAETTVPAP